MYFIMLRYFLFHTYHSILLKVATLIHNVFHHRCPAYLHNLVTFTESDSARSRRSSFTGACPNADRPNADQWKLSSKGRMPTAAGRNADRAENRPGAMPNIPIVRDHNHHILSIDIFVISAYSVLV